MLGTKNDGRRKKAKERGKVKGAVYGMGDVMSTAVGTYERRKLFFPINVDSLENKVAVYGMAGVSFFGKVKWGNQLGKRESYERWPFMG